MIENVIEKREAAFILDDELTEIYTMLEKLIFINFHLSLDYFGFLDIDDKRIQCEYKSASIMHDIASDYIYQINKKIQSLLNYE